MGMGLSENVKPWSWSQWKRLRKLNKQKKMRLNSLFVHLYYYITSGAFWFFLPTADQINALFSESASCCYHDEVNDIHMKLPDLTLFVDKEVTVSLVVIFQGCCPLFVHFRCGGAGSSWRARIMCAHGSFYTALLLHLWNSLGRHAGDPHGRCCWLVVCSIYSAGA